MNDYAVTGKIALVTGGGTGIGKAIAAALAKNGAKVAIASRTSAHVEGAAEELQSRWSCGAGAAARCNEKKRISSAVSIRSCLSGARLIFL